jgi:hypothetical protein
VAVVALISALLGACVVNEELYRRRLDALTDDDGDGVTEDGGDCNDADPDVLPGAEEHCDGVDEDCDGTVDEGASDGAALPDADGDGYGDAAAAPHCVALAGEVTVGGDCDDDDAEVHPGADERCDGLDDDCDGEVDEDAVDAVPWYRDEDDDGYGGEVDFVACEGFEVMTGGDCDDGDPEAYPGAEEVCDAVDNDCDGDVDEGATDAVDGWQDADGDGYGDGATAVEGCAGSEGFATNADDCDDGDAAVYPGAREVLDGRDNDCDEGTDPDALTVDDADATLTGEATGDAAGVALTWCDDAGRLLVGAGIGMVYAVDAPVAAGSLGDAPFVATGWTGGLACGDLDGDGDGELALGTADGVALVAEAATGTPALSAELDADEVDALVVVEGVLVAASGATVTVWADGTSEAASWSVDGFAGAVALADAGDVDGDGADDLAIGDPAGSVAFVYALDGATLLATLVGEGEADEAGAAVAGVGDLDGNGRYDLAVGAPGYDDAGTDSGRVYAVYGPISGTEELAAADGWWRPKGGNGRFGSVLGAADLDADGTPEVLFGIPSAQIDGWTDGGVAYVWLGLLFGEGSIVNADAAIAPRASASYVGTALGAGAALGSGAAALLVSGGQEGAGSVYLFATSY